MIFEAFDADCRPLVCIGENILFFYYIFCLYKQGGGRGLPLYLYCMYNWSHCFISCRYEPN